MKKYWVTKTGEKIKISNMTTTHIINCIKMLENKYNHGEFMSYFGYSDGELEYFDKGIEDFTDRAIYEVFPIYTYLEEELKKRLVGIE